VRFQIAVAAELANLEALITGRADTEREKVWSSR
jgi:hypothetical protein